MECLDLSRYPLERLLQERFLILKGFHPGQKEIIEQLLQKKRVLAIQKTGWGKSLCYQMASLYYPYLTIIFSPLKALMRDQCQKCNEVYGIPAAIISSDFSEEENENTLKNALQNNIKLLFIAPERLGNELWKEYSTRLRISMIVIDEAHCISTWGHDFRPHYQRLVHLLDAIPGKTPVLALTATANKRVQQDILQQMGNDVLVIRGPMKRTNLQLGVVTVVDESDKLGYLATIIPTFPGTGIIYAATRSSTEMIAAFLNDQQIDATYYHSSRERDIKQGIEQQLYVNSKKVICATNALGMGIDKPDIRFIIHYHIPSSPIPYYQEIGRAGRDGGPANCILLFQEEDTKIQKHFIQNAQPTSNNYERMLTLIRSQQRGLGEHEIMRRTGFSQKTTRKIVSDLEMQGFIAKGSKGYEHTIKTGAINIEDYNKVREQKLQELIDMQTYTRAEQCYMNYLAQYLGDTELTPCNCCSFCRTESMPSTKSSEKMKEQARYFLNQIYTPCIEEKKDAYKAGISLSYHGISEIGQLVRASKYEGAGSFADGIVERAIEALQRHYPLNTIKGIVSVPPTVSGGLVEDFARRIAAKLKLPYLAIISKQRTTQEQKYLKNSLQKEDNVKGAFLMRDSKAIIGQIVLLIDDIYDSGKILQEVGKTLLQAGAQAVYPFTITRTLHSDDQ